MSAAEERKPLRVDTSDQENYGTVSKPISPLDRPQSWVSTPKNYSPPAPEYIDPQKAQRSAQKAFLTKVYAVLSIQLAITVAACGMCMYIEPLRYTAVNQGWVFIVALLSTFVWIILMFLRKNNYPDNLIILGGFTLTWSWLLGTIAAIYQTDGDGELIFIAWGITLFIFVILTIVVAVSNIDFSWLGLVLLPCLLAFCIWGWVNIIFGFHVGWLYSLLGALLFSAYIVFDSWMIMNKLGYDDWPIACIELYLDIINLFLHILSLLGRRG